MNAEGRLPASDQRGTLRLTVFGANGGSGAAAVAQALAAGHDVTAVTRHPEQFSQRHERLTIFRGDATIPADVMRALDGADVVLSALGVPYSKKPISLYSRSAECIVDAMQQANVRRLIAVTSSAVDPNGFPVEKFVSRIVGRYLIGPLVHRLGRTMYEDMVRMEKIIQASDLDWTILRPPALFNADTAGAYEVSLTPMVGQFVSRQDLGAIMLNESTSTQHIRKTLYVRSVEGRPSIVRTIWEDGIKKKFA